MTAPGGHRQRGPQPAAIGQAHCRNGKAFVQGRGAKARTLQNTDVDRVREALVVVTSVPGFGKRSGAATPCMGWTSQPPACTRPLSTS